MRRLKIKHNIKFLHVAVPRRLLQGISSKKEYKYELNILGFTIIKR